MPSDLIEREAAIRAARAWCAGSGMHKYIADLLKDIRALPAAVPPGEETCTCAEKWTWCPVHESGDKSFRPVEETPPEPVRTVADALREMKVGTRFRRGGWAAESYCQKTGDDEFTWDDARTWNAAYFGSEDFNGPIIILDPPPPEPKAGDHGDLLRRVLVWLGIGIARVEALKNSRKEGEWLFTEREKAIQAVFAQEISDGKQLETELGGVVKGVG